MKPFKKTFDASITLKILLTADTEEKAQECMRMINKNLPWSAEYSLHPDFRTEVVETEVNMKEVKKS